MKKGFILAFLFVLSICSYAQIGGSQTYGFLNLTNSARAASLGGNVIGIKDSDLNLVYHNPSLLDESMHNNLLLNYINYFSGINYGYASYARHFNKYGTFAAGIHYINYGEFIEANETGEITGNFKASDYSFNIYWAMPLDSFFTVGAALKVIYSSLQSYSSMGLAADIGITYHNPKLFTAALVLKNVGSQLKPYVKGNYEPIPFDIQLSISKRLKHAPFRLILQLQHLQKYNLMYENENDPEPSEDPITGEPIEEKKFENFMDNLGRHMVFGLEVIPLKSFYIRLGYNHQRRQELKISTRTYMVGISIGVGLRISKFHISYGRASYHLAGASNHISISTNLSDFYKREPTL